ncbi:MAG TPA: nucleosidase [Patescibacteria group bacterium]|nr:nucleosidase [Patescibacteria group bacterium]
MTVLIAAALEDELGDYFRNEMIVYTGVGKVNAAYALTKAISKKRPALVFNLGSAASRTHPRGSVLLCTKFYQRDMDVSPLGFPVGVTPFSSHSQILDLNHTLHDAQGHTCSSGDNFVTSGVCPQNCDVFDMEAYSLALVCKNEDIPFFCLKYVTDDGNEQAAADWQQNVKNSGRALSDAYRKILSEVAS